MCDLGDRQDVCFRNGKQGCWFESEDDSKRPMGKSLWSTLVLNVLGLELDSFSFPYLDLIGKFGQKGDRKNGNKADTVLRCSF